MVVMDGNSTDQDLAKLWGLVVELSEQLSKARGMASSLHSQSIQLKSQAFHSETGFVLRRFNLHLSKEEYDAELERMNVSMASENQALAHDNKQLNSLLKEYEQTLESVMSTFRTRAHDVQEHELTLMRSYESMLLSSETTALSDQLAVDTSISVLIARCSHLLRTVLRLMGGEEPESSSTSPEDSGLNESRNTNPEMMDSLDWALERECELVRLQKENEELRWLLKAGEVDPNALPPTLPRVPLSTLRSMFPRRQRMRGRAHSEFGSVDMRNMQQEVLQELRDMSEEQDDTLVM